MEQWHRCVRASQLRKQRFLARLQPRSMLHPEPVHLARELLAEFLEEILAQPLFLKCQQDLSLDFITSNGQGTQPCLVSRRV
jgi:hypothetical protein